MKEKLVQLLHQAQSKIRSIILGTTLALATILMSQFGGSCATTGQ
jgi:hypothetical protein